MLDLVGFDNVAYEQMMLEIEAKKKKKERKKKTNSIVNLKKDSTLLNSHQ